MADADERSSPEAAGESDDELPQMTMEDLMRLLHRRRGDHDDEAEANSWRAIVRRVHARAPRESEQEEAFRANDLGRESVRSSGAAPSHLQALEMRRRVGGEAGPRWRARAGGRFLPCRPTERLSREARSRIYNGQFTRSGETFVSASQDNGILVFDVAEWSCRKRIEARDINWTITGTDTTPDERFVLYSTISNVLHLCNLRGDVGVHEALDVSQGEEHFGIWCCKFSAGGTEAVAGTSDCSLLVYDVEQKRRVLNVVAHRDDINAVCFFDEGYRSTLMATGSDDSLIKVWDRRTLGSGGGRPVGVMPGHTEGVTSLSPRGDGRYIVSNGKDQTARLWDVRSMLSSDAHDALPRVDPRTGFDYRWQPYPSPAVPHSHPHDQSVMTFRGHQVLNTLIRAHFSPAATTGNRYIYSGSADGCVYIWDLLSGKPRAVLGVPSPGRRPVHAGPVRDVSWHPHLPILCTSSWDGSNVVWRYDPAHMDAVQHDMETVPAPPARERGPPRVPLGLAEHHPILRMLAARFGMAVYGSDDDSVAEDDDDDDDDDYVPARARGGLDEEDDDDDEDEGSEADNVE